jgi:hypothetical protein
MTEQNLKEIFDRDGFIILRGFFSEQEAQMLLEKIQSCPHPNNKDRLTKGAMTFYSNIYRYSEEIQKFAAQQKIVDVLTELSAPDIWMRHDQAVAKEPGAGTFPWHQDNGYNKLKDGHFQFWIALTEMNQDNGGLWLQPGSHKQSLPHKKVGNEQVYEGVPESPVAIDAKPGDVIIFSSFCLHSTTPNITQKQRWAYVLEYMSLDYFDPFLEPPYFIIAKDGKSCPEFVESYRGSQDLGNRLKYNLRMDGKIKRWVRQIVKKPSSVSR